MDVNVLYVIIVLWSPQVDVCFLYLGSRFTKESNKLSRYLSSRNSLTLEFLKSRLSNDMYQYVQFDLEEFVTNFCPSSKELLPKFNKINEDKYIWVFAVPYHVTSYGIVIPIRPCDQTTYGAHAFMASFHKDNKELLVYYEEINRGDDAEKRQIMKIWSRSRITLISLMKIQYFT